MRELNYTLIATTRYEDEALQLATQWQIAARLFFPVFPLYIFSFSLFFEDFDV